MKIFLTVLASLVGLVFLLACIDREVARQDYLNGGEVSGCIFEFNCQHFNNMD
jgi:hypothetical protein